MESKLQKCTQCGKPAIQPYGDNYLCLDCLEKISLIQSRSAEQRHREIIYHMQMSNAAEKYINETMSGIGSQELSFDLNMFQPSRTVKLNSVNVSNSIVGNISTEEVGNIQVSLKKINASGDAEAAAKLHELTTAIISTNEIEVERKNEILEQISLLTEQISLPKQNRKKGIIKAAASAIKETASTITSVAGAWGKIETFIAKIG